MQTNQKDKDSSLFEDLALLYEYPTEELIPVISLLIKKFSTNSNNLLVPIIEKLRIFFDYCSSNTLAKLEEDYIATYEMNTKYILYIGHLLFGENYERSEFISQLQHLYDENDFKIDQNELPDHISVILKFLSKKTVSKSNKRKLMENILASFRQENNAKDKQDQTYLMNLNEDNKYPLLYFLLTDLVEVFKIWEIE